MTVSIKEAPIISQSEFEQLKARLKTTWNTGDYDLFSRHMEKDAEQFFLRLHIAPGARVLDVGCGSGQLALIAARAGLQATGCDIAPNWIKKANERAAAEGLNACFYEADAEDMPFAEGQFDAVVSIFGAMFAPRPELVAEELTRVCRPGGLLAMANWTPGGFIGQMFKIIARHIAPSGMPSPALWGDEPTVRERLRDGTADLQCTVRRYHFEYPFPPAAVVDFFREYYGPMHRAFASLDSAGQQRLRDELTSLWAAHNYAGGNATKVDAEYLEVLATRAGGPANESPAKTITRKGDLMSRRAQSLAERIEEGAAGLAAFAETLTDAEWSMPVSDTDRRTIGIIVHHVASVYPIEVDLAKAIAAGKPVTDVTWEVVAQLNAKHAQEQAGATKSATLELLRSNSSAAAVAVRSFTDADLDAAGPFGLSYGAPVTAQFVIEDHALRHSWHHLARIRKMLRR
jgi:SAM-dependent methyltransferase